MKAALGTKKYTVTITFDLITPTADQDAPKAIHDAVDNVMNEIIDNLEEVIPEDQVESVWMGLVEEENNGC
jgi:hypothetical protein